MSVGFKLEDGKGSRYAAHVNSHGELSVIPTDHPPLEAQKTRPFRQYFTDDGLATGSNDMGVDGSVTPAEFYVATDPDVDRYIKQLSFIVAYGGSGAPYLWADGAALATGIRIYYTSTPGEQDIHDGILSNQDLFRLSDAPLTSVWQLRHVNANNDYGYFVSVDLTVFGSRHGIKLDRGADQRLVISIRDNVGLAADTFNCIAYGFDRFE